MARASRSPLHVWARAAALALAAAAPALAGEGAFDPAPWIEDLQQIRAAMTQKYANFEWAVFERRIPLGELFDATERRLFSAASDADARQIIDLSLKAVGDGHLGVKWPGSGASRDPRSAPTLCARLGYDAAMRGEALAGRLPGYRPVADAAGAEFPAAQLRSGEHKVGVLRIGMFAPQGYPELCEAVRGQLDIAQDASCDEACAGRVEGAVYEWMARDLALRVRQLERLGSTVLMVDITGNGGGSQWAEAAARLLSPVDLTSEHREGVRGEHWAAYWRGLAAQLRLAAQASPEDAKQLEQWAQQVDGVRQGAETPCSAVPFWSGKRPGCAWLAPAFYATGILPAADAAGLHGKPWGALVFSPAEYDFEAAVWHGPLVLLVDAGTASAAEEFAAVLQDNKAAVIAGTRTFGAGCGRTRGGTPTELAHSHGILLLPDCARLRADGSNEVGGIDPEVPLLLPAPADLRDSAWKVQAWIDRAVETSLRLCEEAHCRGGERASRP